MEIPENERYELERFSTTLAISYPEKHPKNEKPFKGKRPVFGKMCSRIVLKTKFLFSTARTNINTYHTRKQITNELYMMKICVQTLSVVKIEKVLIENSSLDKMFVCTEKFQNYFYDEKEQKLLIDVSDTYPTYSSLGLSLDYSALPTFRFDVKKHRFYLKELSVQSPCPNTFVTTLPWTRTK